MDTEGHWLLQLRRFVDDALSEVADHQDKLEGCSLALKEYEPLESMLPSIWVDGGSGQIDMTGGSVYVVRAAAGLFSPKEPVSWHTDMKAGFTTLPRNVDRFVGIQRDILEVETALELLHKGAKFVVLDNSLASYATMGLPYSILGQFTASQPDDSPEHEYFQAFVRFKKRFDTLIRECQIQGIMLIGAAKDPKSRTYVRELGIGSKFTDSTTIAMLAGGRIGFTKPIKTRYLVVDRVKQHLEAMSVLVDGRGDFLTVFGILKPWARVFKLDYLENHKGKAKMMKQFITSMHDGNGYLLPSHVVHNKATISQTLLKSLGRLVVSRIAKQDMTAARFVFGSQRRSRFG